MKIAIAGLLIFLSFQIRAQNRGVSLSIEEAVQQGLKANLDLLAAQFNIPLAQAEALSAGLYNNPSVTLDALAQPFGSNWDQTNSGGPKQTDLIFSYPLDVSGKRSSAEKSAKEGVKVTEATFQDSVRQKVREIRLAYIDLLVAEQQLSLSHEKEDRLRHLVEVLERRIGKKEILPLLLVRAQLARDQAKLDASQREIALRAAKINISVLLGYKEGVEIQPSTKLRDFVLGPLPDKAALIKNAIESRPDVLGLKIAIKKTEYDRELARAQVWDNFVVSAGLTTQGPTNSNSTSGSLGQANSYNLSVTIPLPTFNRNQGNVTKAGLLGQQTVKQLESLSLAITQEVSGLFDQLLAGQNLIKAYEGNQLKQARAVRDAQSRLFATGSTALLDYFDGINAYISVYSSYYDAVGEYRKNLVRINSSLGKDEL